MRLKVHSFRRKYTVARNLVAKTHRLRAVTQQTKQLQGLQCDEKNITWVIFEDFAFGVVGTAADLALLGFYFASIVITVSVLLPLLLRPQHYPDDYWWW